MEKTVAQVYQCLQKLIGLHRQLLETVRAEREALIQADLKAIEEVTQAKQLVLDGIRLAETERLKKIVELALLWKRPLKELTVANIAIAIQGGDLKSADQFRASNTTLTILIQRITDQNRDNQILVERSLTHIGEMKKNILGQTVPKSETYTQQGQRATGMSGARLISKEA